MNRIILHLSLITGVGPAVILKIVRVLPYERFEELYQWSVQHFVYRAGISEQAAKLIVQGLLDDVVLEKELRLIEQYGINVITLDEREYPALLRVTYLPPIVLYWQGRSFDILDRAVAMIGSRKATTYGQRAIESFVPNLVAAGWSLVSGGALGADTMVHKASLRAGGKTIAVIGSGLLCPYPRSNIKLFEAIIERGGMVMSPFPLTMEALPGNFPARNRIISGLSSATVVIQAAAKSGALITALFALEQGRDVCALPGPFDDPLSEGCHALLQEGAQVVTSAETILKILGSEIYKTVRTQEHIFEQVDSEREPLERIVKQVKDPVVEACKIPQTFDDLCLLLGYDELQLQERLVTLQLEKVIDQDIMGRWYLNI